MRVTATGPVRVVAHNQTLPLELGRSTRRFNDKTSHQASNTARASPDGTGPVTRPAKVLPALDTVGRARCALRISVSSMAARRCRAARSAWVICNAELTAAPPHR